MFTDKLIFPRSFALESSSICEWHNWFFSSSWSFHLMFSLNIFHGFLIEIPTVIIFNNIQRIREEEEERDMMRPGTLASKQIPIIICLWCSFFPSIGTNYFIDRCERSQACNWNRVCTVYLSQSPPSCFWKNTETLYLFRTAGGCIPHIRYWICISKNPQSHLHTIVSACHLKRT